MAIVNIHQAKTHLSRLVEEVSAGKELIIGKAGKPLAKLVPLKPAKPVRKPGFLKGKIKMAGQFVKSLPASVVAAFEGRRRGCFWTPGSIFGRRLAEALQGSEGGNRVGGRSICKRSVDLGSSDQDPDRQTASCGSRPRCRNPGNRFFRDVGHGKTKGCRGRSGPASQRSVRSDADRPGDP